MNKYTVMKRIFESHTLNEMARIWFTWGKIQDYFLYKPMKVLSKKFIWKCARLSAYLDNSKSPLEYSSELTAAFEEAMYEVEEMIKRRDAAIISKLPLHSFIQASPLRDVKYIRTYFNLWSTVELED